MIQYRLKKYSGVIPIFEDEKYEATFASAKDKEILLVNNQKKALILTVSDYNNIRNKIVYLGFLYKNRKYRFLCKSENLKRNLINCILKHIETKETFLADNTMYHIYIRYNSARIKLTYYIQDSITKKTAKRIVSYIRFKNYKDLLDLIQKLKTKIDLKIYAQDNRGHTFYKVNTPLTEKNFIQILTRLGLEPITMRETSTTANVGYYSTPFWVSTKEQTRKKIKSLEKSGYEIVEKDKEENPEDELARVEKLINNVESNLDKIS